MPTKGGWGKGSPTKAAQAEGSLKMAKCAQRIAQIERERQREQVSFAANSNLIGSELRSTRFQLDSNGKAQKVTVDNCID